MPKTSCSSSANSEAGIAARDDRELRRGHIIGFGDQDDLDAARAIGESGT